MVIEKLGIDWVNKAKIEKIDEGNTIKLSAEENRIYLRHNRGKNKVNLEINNCKTAEFDVESVEGELKVYNNSLKDFSIVICPEKTPLNIVSFWRLYFEGKGLTVAEMTCDEHDRVKAYSLCVTQLLGRAVDKIRIWYLFSWKEIPGNDSLRLTDFLKSNYDLDWVKTAKIAKTNNDKTIMITDEKHSLSLNLNNENTELNLIIDKDKTYKFIAKTENGKLNIYKIGIISSKGITSSNIDTGDFKNLLKMREIACEDTLELFQGLQLKNPFARIMRDELIENLKKIEKDLLKIVV